MGKGARPKAEFVDSAKRPRGADAQTPVVPSRHEIRVVRQASPLQGHETDGWHELLDNLGNMNYGKGRAHSLGSVAVVYVGGKDMDRMLYDRHPDCFRTPAKAFALKEKVSNGIKQFMRSAFEKGYHTQTSDMIASHGQLMAAMRIGGVSNEIDGPHAYWDSESADLACVDEDSLRQLISPDSIPYFGIADVQVDKDLKLYGKDGFGLNLEISEQLRGERESVLDYLHDYENLRTDNIANGWTPHATIFTFEQHVSPMPLVYRAKVPPVISLEPPRSLMY